MLLILSASGCGIDALGPYGNEWVATPNLDRLAAEGEVYDRHFSVCPAPTATRADWWADLPAGAVLIRNTRPANDAPPDLCGRFANVIDARPVADDRSPADALLRVLPTVLDRAPSLLWVDTDRLLPPWNVWRDVFDVYLEDLTEDGGDGEAVSPWSDPETGFFDPDDLIAWELLHRTHAAAVTGFDADLGRVFALLRARGLDASATWAFTSDFGYPLGQHGLIGPHRPHLHDEFVHLPLIVRRPGGCAGDRESQFTQPSDVLPILRGEPLPKRESVATRWAANGAEEAALRTDGFTLLLPLNTPDDEPREPMLFEMPDDPHEANDVRQVRLELTDELEAELRARLTASPSSPSVSPAGP